MNHLPDWVQTNAVAALRSGPDERAITFTTLPAWTFLRVLGAQNDRLQIMYVGDGGSRQAGPGWVSLSDVQPSDAGGPWLRNHVETPVFDGPAPGSAIAVQAPQWSYLRVDGGQKANRIPVSVYSLDLSTVRARGWVPSEAVGPTGGPRASVYTVKPMVPQVLFKTQQAFIEAVGRIAKESAQKTQVPASLTVAQAILESDWGRSVLTRQANNYFGIKAFGSVGSDGVVWMRTLEYSSSGEAYYSYDPFRAYASLADGVQDHSLLFTSLPRYGGAMRVSNNPDEFARRIAAAGYSTDPSYPDKLIGLMERYDLYRLDTSTG